MACIAALCFARSAPAVKRAGVFSAAAALGCAAASFLCASMGARTAAVTPGMPAESITSFTCVLNADSARSRQSRTMMRVSLLQARSESLGVSAAAKGNVLLVMEGEYGFALGQMLEVRAGLSPMTEPGREAFIAFTDRGGARDLGFSSPVWEARSRLRDNAERSLEKAGYPSAALLQALLIGSRDDVPQDLERAFERTGSLHILALSGLHASVVFAVAASLFGLFRRRLLTYLSAMAVLAFYQFIAGPMPSLLRAVLMLGMGGAAVLLDRDTEPLNLLCLSGILMLVFDPYQAWDASFQLSFLAVLGIIAVSPALSRPLEGRAPPALLAPFSLSAAAQIATFPVVASAFGAYYPSGLVAGLILVPLTTAYLWMGLAWLLISPILGGVLQHAAVWVFDAVYRCILAASEFFSRVPGIAFPPEAGPWVACAGSAVLAALCFWGGRRKPA